MPTDGERTETIRALSQTLFGGAHYRLEVGRAIAEGGGSVCIKDLASELGDPPGSGSVNTELKKFEQAGLLRRAPRQSSERKVYLDRQEAPFWDFCVEMARRCEAGWELGP